MTMSRSSPLATYSALTAIAEKAGLRVVSRDAVKITGDVPESFMKRTPDYSRIRKVLLNGSTLPFAELTGLEYSLVHNDDVPF